MNLSLAYSPCPNDTYIFAALTNGLLSDAPRVDVVLDDVEALNEAADRSEHALTKVSYGAIPYLTERYRILRAGGALGRGCGPLLIARPRADGSTVSLGEITPTTRVAIPGERTTAYLLLRLALGFSPCVVAMRFDRIVDAIAEGTVEAGIIIHESRFTYARAGLREVVDLGEWWEETTGQPIPLGAILARRDLSDETTRAVNIAIRRSLAFAQANDAAIIDYVRAHAAEMEDDVMRKHIALYVNAFSDDIGESGEAAVKTLFEHSAAQGLIPRSAQAEFVG